MSIVMSLEQNERIAVDYDPFAGGTLARVVPTTEPQREIWFANQFGRDASLAFNLSVSLRLRGRLDVEALAAALQLLVDRHDALRANFGPGGETLCIREACGIGLPFTDLSTLDTMQRNDAVDDRVRSSVETPFLIDRDLLFRAELLKLEEEEHLLLLTAHHIVCDGWSWWVIVRELGALYALHSGSSGVTLDAPEDFSEYALAETTRQADAEASADEAYWLSRFAGEVPVLDLPTDHPRPMQRSFASCRIDHVIDAELTSAIRRMGARRGASLFATMLAGFSGLLSRLTGQPRVVVGIPAAGQSVGGHADLIGHCVNTLPLRFDMDTAQPFAQALDDAQATVLDAFEHQRYTFGTLLGKLRIKRDPSRMPLVSVLFNIDQASDKEGGAFPGLELEVHDNPRSFEVFEMFLNIAQAKGELRIECQYNRDLFDDVTVRRWLKAYEALLRAAVDSPAASFASLPLLDHSMMAELEDLQPPAVPFDRERRMHEVFEVQCDASPARVAVQCGDMAASYLQLESRANRIAHLLRSHGVQHGSLVGLAVDRGIDMLAALLGILKAGAGYVPLDPQFPADRLAYMAEDAGLAALITETRHASLFDLRGRPILALDQLGAELEALPDTRIGRDPLAATPESIAYVIYTSGSTGRPKGVQVPHRAVSNFITGMQRQPGLQADDRLLAVTTLSFDIAVLELLLPLSVGARVVLAERESVSDPQALSSLISQRQCTVMQATPATWRLLLDSGWSGGQGFKALCGGEPLAPDLAAQLLSGCSELWNLYGPTETTVWSTCMQVLPPQDGAQAPDIHIGKAIANTRIWILDAQGEPCPRGVPGEICIGGDGVTLGYLNRPELTADRFIADRFASPGAFGDGLPAPLLYRTGDLGRWRTDGNLEHMGRLDFQVKIRGYRIELGEIENTLASHPAVARVVALAREDRPGDVRLVTYVVAQAGLEIQEPALLAHMRSTLPEYMIPQHVVVLDAIPLLPNGKIDRKSLPAPGTSAGHQPEDSTLQAPRTATERIIAVAMANALGMEAVGMDGDFFAMGGYSLLAARLSARLRKDLDHPMPLRALFDHPTVRALAAFVDASRSQMHHPARTALVPHRENDRAPMSLMQQSLWLMEQFYVGRTAMNLPAAHRLHGPLDVGSMQRAFDQMVHRQSALRTAIVEEGGSFVQRVYGNLEGPFLPVEDLSALPEAQREAELRARKEQLIRTPFDMSQAPLFRACLFKMAPDDHELFFVVHHIVFDGESFDIYLNELVQLYIAHSRGVEASLPPLPVSYGDFANWQREWVDSEHARLEVKEWLAELTPLPDALELPLDRLRPPVMSGQGETLPFKLSKERGDQARALGMRQDATLSMTLLAAYFMLLHRLTGQDDLVVGVPVRGRDLIEVDPVMGLFRNTLPLRVRLDPNWSFSRLVTEVRSRMLEALSRPSVSFEELVDGLNVVRDLSRHPIYQALFSFQDRRAQGETWPGLRCDIPNTFPQGATEDIGIWLDDVPDGVDGSIAYNADIITPQSADSIVGRFVRLLESALDAPDMSISQLDALTGVERERLLEWNATGMDYPRSAAVHQLFEAAVDRAPGRIAVSFAGDTLDYLALEERSNRIARTLRARGVGNRALVGLCLERGFDMVAAVMGVLKSGAAYVPLDPVFPQDRLAFMANDAGLALMVSSSDLSGLVEWPRDRTLQMDADGQEIAAADPSRLPPDSRSATPESLAYILYTSGSTGKPKGVKVPHGAVVNFLCSMQREPGLGPEDRLLAVTTLSFDIAALELFLPLMIGAEIVLASREQARDGDELRTLIESRDATLMQATPTTWQLLLETGWKGGADFRALVGGEALPLDLSRQLALRCSEVWNMYGPTETTVWSTCWKVRDPDAGIWIGRPIANTTVWILGEQNQLCPVGVAGEIWIGGEGVTQGYLHRPELTAERFIPDPFSDRPGARLYRTGDRGRWLDNGMLQHMGRLDFQVKVRGYRIELGEIEGNIADYPGVARVVVVAREDRPGDVRLVAYVMGEPGRAVREDELLAHLKSVLPNYMVPQHVVEMDVIPLLPNGKIDRKSLPVPLMKAVEATVEAVAGSANLRHDPRVEGDPRIKYLVGIWDEMLGAAVTPDDNFFDLGGHSMLAVQMANRVARETGVKLRLLSLATQSLAQAAAMLPMPEQAATVASSPAAGGRWLRYFKRILGRSDA